MTTEFPSGDEQAEWLMAVHDGVHPFTTDREDHRPTPWGPIPHHRGLVGFCPNCQRNQWCPAGYCPWCGSDIE